MGCTHFLSSSHARHTEGPKETQRIQPHTIWIPLPYPILQKSVTADLVSVHTFESKCMWLSSKVWRMAVDSFTFSTIRYPLLEWQYITVIKRGCGPWCLHSLTRRKKKTFPLKYIIFIFWKMTYCQSSRITKNSANYNVYF